MGITLPHSDFWEGQLFNADYACQRKLEGEGKESKYVEAAFEQGRINKVWGETDIVCMNVS